MDQKKAIREALTMTATIERSFNPTTFEGLKKLLGEVMKRLMDLAKY